MVDVNLEQIKEGIAETCVKAWEEIVKRPSNDAVDDKGRKVTTLTLDGYLGEIWTDTEANKVHATRLKTLAEELDVGLRIGEDIVEYSNDKAIEVRITLGKCQLKLEGVLFMKAATISVERAFIPNNSLEGIIRDFVSYCRGIDSHIECYQKD